MNPDAQPPVKSEDELREQLSRIGYIFGDGVYETDNGHTVDDLTQLIKQREARTARAAVLAELKTLMAIPGGTVDAWAPLAHNHIASRITQLTTTHEGGDDE